MSLTQLWATLRAAWLRIGLMVLVAASVAFGLASQLPKQYTAKARVMLNIDNDDPNQYSALKRGTVASYIGTEMRLVSDNAVTRDVVTKLGWPDNPQVVSAWEASTGGTGDLTNWAAHQVGANISAQPFEDSSILEIYYSSSSLDAAKQIVAMIRNSYIDQSQKLRADAARRAAAWNRTETARALAIVRAAEASRAAFVTANQIPVNSLTSGLEYQAQAVALAATASQEGQGAAAKVNATADTLARQLNSLDAELAVRRLNGPQNPATIALEAQRASVAQQLARETAVTQAGPNVTSEQIGLVRHQRDADYLAARLRLLDRAPLYDQLARMDRDILLKTNRYNAAAARVATFDTVAAAPSGLKIIGDVIADDEPSYPNIPLMTAIAAASSLALAIAITLLAELSRPQIRGAEELRFFTGAPVLAVIGGTAERRGQSLLARIASLKAGAGRSGAATSATV